MKSDFTIQQLAQRITERAEKKVDLIADTRSVQYKHTSNELIVGEHSLRVNDHAHSQIATQLDIPSRYYNKMRQEAPALLGDNIRTWFDKYPVNRMVRALDNTARAWLSDKYNRMDDDAFANVVLPTIYDVPGAEVRSTGMTDLKTTLKFVSPRFEYQVKKGDIVRFGVAYSNSEVGAGRLTGALFCEQLVCTNGMVIEAEMFASTHVGAKHVKRDLGEIFQLDTLKADGQATILKLRDFTKELLSESFLQSQVAKMTALTEHKLESPVRAVEVMGKQQSWNDGQKNDVLKYLIEGGDLSMWGMQNAVTRAAADQLDYDDATRMETLGGRMLTLPKAEYSAILQAA